MARILWAVLWLCVAGGAAAQNGSLFATRVGVTRAAVIQAPREPSAPSGPAAPSLFGGPTGLFAPMPDRSARTAPRSAPMHMGTGRAPVDRLLALIALAEAGPAGYDAVQYGARIRPARPPTQMTLGEIYAWIAATPGQPHAIGRYQFIPSTLRRVARERGFGPETRFTPGVQDALALVLLEDAGLSAFEAGELDRVTFMRNLARIWAGLPLPNGRSYYHGHAGNAATMTWARFEAGMATIWPVRG